MVKILPAWSCAICFCLRWYLCETSLWIWSSTRIWLRTYFIYFLTCHRFQTLQGNSIWVIILMLMTNFICPSSQPYLIMGISLCLTSRAMWMKWITECWWATLTAIKTRLSYWHSLFNILHNHFFEISQLQMKPFTPCSIAVIFDSHFCLINILPIFANVWFNHLRNMNYTMRYQMQTTKAGSLQCSTLWLPNSTMKRLQHVLVKKATSA